MNCPNCGQKLPASFVDMRLVGKKGGIAKGPSKARTSEQARAAINARWAKRKTM